jgi:hypothetical protein
LCNDMTVGAGAHQGQRILHFIQRNDAGKGIGRQIFEAGIGCCC